MTRMNKLMLAFLMSVIAFDAKIYSELYLNKEEMYVKTLNSYSVGNKQVSGGVSIVYNENDERASDEQLLPENENKTDISSEITEPKKETISETKKENAVDTETESHEMPDLSPYISSVKDSMTKIKNFYQSCIEKSEEPSGGLYVFEKNTNLLDANGKVVGSIKKGELYTGAPDTENEGMILIDYQYSTIPVKSESLKKKDDTTILPTAAIGQMGGKINGVTACGPTAVTILIDWEKQTDTSKDDLIRYSKEHDLEDQGAIDKPHGGMTAPRLIELTDGYYKGEITAKNIYNDKPLQTLDEQIDSGHRALVAVRYTWNDLIVADNPYSGVHFVIVCGYEDEEKGRSYYYADPYYGNGGHSLLKVSANKLENSMKQVNSEPKTLIVLA